MWQEEASGAGASVALQELVMDLRLRVRGAEAAEAAIKLCARLGTELDPVRAKFWAHVAERVRDGVWAPLA